MTKFLSKIQTKEIIRLYLLIQRQRHLCFLGYLICTLLISFYACTFKSNIFSYIGIAFLLITIFLNTRTLLIARRQQEELNSYIDFIFTEKDINPDLSQERS